MCWPLPVGPAACAPATSAVLCCAVLCCAVCCVQVGGFEAYLLADEEEEQSGAAAVYRQVCEAESERVELLLLLIDLLAC